MDQKKTLWIIAAVGAFLLVVLGAAIVMYAPTHKPGILASNYPSAGAQVSKQLPARNNPPEVRAPNPADGYIPEPAAPVPASPAKVNELYVVSENTKVYNAAPEEPSETTIDLNTLKQAAAAETQVQPAQSVQPPAVQPQNINITVNIPDGNKAETYVTSEYKSEGNTAAAPKVEAPKVEASVNKVQTASAKTPAKTTVKAQPAAPAKTTAKPAVKAAASKPAVTTYWVQVAAYSNKKGAETARSILDTNKITSDIFTYKDNKDNLFYRVRVGPYTTKSEAEYWRTRIIKIDEFAKAESYVTSTTN